MTSRFGTEDKIWNSCHLTAISRNSQQRVEVIGVMLVKLEYSVLCYSLILFSLMHQHPYKVPEHARSAAGANTIDAFCTNSVRLKHEMSLLPVDT